MKTSGIIIRVVALLLILVHLYNLFAQDTIPRWSYALFTIAMLLIVVLNISQYSKSHK